MSGVDRNSHRSDPAVSSIRDSPDASPPGSETRDSSRPMDPAASIPTEEGERADIPGPYGLPPQKPIDIPGQQPPPAVHVAGVNPPDPREQHPVAGFRLPLAQVPGDSDSSARNSPKSKSKDRFASKRDVEVFHNLSFAFCATRLLTSPRTFHWQALKKELIASTKASTTEIKTAIATSTGEVTGAIDRLGGKVDRLGDKVDRLGDKVDALVTKVDALVSGQDRLAKSVDTLVTKVDTLVTKLESGQDRLAKSIDALVTKLEAGQAAAAAVPPRPRTAGWWRCLTGD